MDMHPAIQVLFAVFVGGLAAIAVVWFYAGLGAWIDDAYDNGRWVWFVALLLFMFPTSLIAWLIVRAMRKRPHVTA